jgi:VCBS repeat-containing protein
VCVEAGVTLAISAVNDTPAPTDDTGSGDEDTTISGNVLSNDQDVDSPTLTASEVTGPVSGTLSLDPNGDFSYTPNSDYSGPDSFTYEVCDGDAACASATVALTVIAVADTPSLSVTPAFGSEGTPFALNITAAANDLDGSEDLEITISNLPEGATLSAGTQNGSSWTLEPGDLSGLMATFADNGSYTLNVQATASEQSNGDTSAVTASLPVSVTNVAPTIDSIELSSTSVQVGEELTATISISDPGSGETLTVTFDWGDGITETFTTTDGTITIDGVHLYLVGGF